MQDTWGSYTKNGNIHGKTVPSVSLTKSEADGADSRPFIYLLKYTILPTSRQGLRGTFFEKTSTKSTKKAREKFGVFESVFGKRKRSAQNGEKARSPTVGGGAQLSTGGILKRKKRRVPIIFYCFFKRTIAASHGGIASTFP